MEELETSPQVQAKLDDWVRAKREKDFTTADAIRADLRALGLEPDILRPPGSDAPGPHSRFDMDTEEKLDQWVVAKRDKNWDMADALRAELRAIGIEPDVVRPPETPAAAAARQAAETEALLDRWVKAKRQKDFE